MANSKQRLFEVMSKVDKSFKPKLNEFYNPQREGIELNPEEVLISYLETALWAEGGDGNMLDGKTIYDIDEKVKQVSLKDIQSFIQQAQQQAPEELANYDARTLGHNLWLSRNGHGAGFFDDNNDTLQNIARAMKSADIYVGDDGKVYIMGTESGGEQPINEMPNWGKTRANPAYTHFAVLKTTGKIINGWEYKGYDQAELRQFKKDYFFNDIKDMQIDPKIVNIVTAKYLQKKGVNPFDYANWHKNDTDGTDIYTLEESTLSENTQGFQRMIVYNIYDKEGDYLGDLEPMTEDETRFIERRDDVISTRQFDKFAQTKNITPEQVGKVRAEREYMMNGNYLSKEYYAPSQSQELFDSKTNTWYNLSGQQMRNPSEYERYTDGTNQWGERYEDD